MRLSEESLGKLPDGVDRFDYDRNAQQIRIVHFGVGAFHRAHMAWYTDRAMSAGESDWAICGVTMRSTDVVEQLAPQDGLYTVTERDGEDAATRLVGAVREVLFAQKQAEQIIEHIASPYCRIISFTVTEKGYARGSGGKLDLALAEESFYPILTEGLRRRKLTGMPGLTLLSCDNLPENGKVLGDLLGQWIENRTPDLFDWVKAKCRIPSSMVDRIVPRASEHDLDAVEEAIGMDDWAAVFTEPFSQWVIEDRFAAGRPCWEDHGAQMVADVYPFETAKLRMLNGAHSLLAYCGLRKGHTYVHEAIADPELRELAERLMREEAAPSVPRDENQDLDAYADRLIERFGNAALNHKLAQIAMDGSEKIPQRWLDTAMWHKQRDGEVPAIREAFDAWIWHLADGRFVDDPLADKLTEKLEQGGRDALCELLFEGRDGEPAVWPQYRGLELPPPA